ncbi:MAG: ABC transporter ATP-binding protein [Oscillospiraceae bacterium]|nr:ABC transporter ATP-binding protein [Oscillospiraceae bacterium]
MQIEIKHIAKKFKRKQVLRDICLEARSGTCIGILGANGCGKSTLLSILAGIQSCNGGSFLCDGVDLLKDNKKRAELVGYVPQGTPLIEELTAKDNLLLWYDKKTMKEQLSDGVLALLGIGEFLSVPVSKMSGGMKKRLSIGCAMAKEPPILLLDEPTAALDLSCKQSIASYLRHYKQSGGLLLLTTHDVLELDLCDAWYIIRDGVLVPFVYDGNVQELVESL